MAKTDDLISLSGVSRSTIFRFLGGGSVRPQTRSAILSAMQQLNMSHEEHSAHKGNILQISVRRDFRAFKGYGLAIARFMSRAEAFGFQVNLRAGNLLDDDSYGKANKKQGKNPSGVLILGMTIEEEEFEIQCFREAGIPHVFVNRVFDDPEVSWVSCNLRLAAKEAVDHLLDLGHRNIGTWGVTHSSRIDRDKRNGFIDAFAKRGLDIPPHCLNMHNDGDLEVAVQNLIDKKELPHAWFCCSDEHAMRFIKVARTNNIRIPEDIAIVSMDDTESSEFLNPALTTIRMPFQNEGAVAFDVLRHLMENPEQQSERIILRHSLIVRESCGAVKKK